MQRSSGILMPIPSLPGSYGIGSIGKSAKQFIDFLAASSIRYWQILPLGPTGYGNSPYQPLSSFAGNPYLIDLDWLAEHHYLKKEELPAVEEEDWIDYGRLYKQRIVLLKKACARMPEVNPDDYLSFVKEEQSWLKDYTEFMAVKDSQQGRSWQQWPQDLRTRQSEAVGEVIAKHHDSAVFYQRVQYLFFRQYKELREYAKQKDVQIIGDLPFYMAPDSIDVWAHPEQFSLNPDGSLSACAGMPGQVWGNPLFNWERMQQDGYAWWIRRAMFQYRFCDMLRIDHFQGFFRYYAIDPNTGEGQWCQGPGQDLFDRLEQANGRKEMLVEDLGELDDAFKAQVKASGFMGMRILEYAFDEKDPGSWYMPFQYALRNACVYTGTHDNNTLMGWIKDEPERAQRACAYFGCTKKELWQVMLKCVWGSPCDLAIVQAQDILRLAGTERTNNPYGGTHNWCWRAKTGAFDAALAAWLKENMKLYCRTAS